MQPDLMLAGQPDKASARPSRLPQPGRSLMRLKLTYASSAPEVLSVFSLTILATAFLWLYAHHLGLPDWSALAAAVLGLSSTIALVLVAMNDPQVIEQAVRQDLSDKMRVDDLRNAEVRRLALQVIAHRARMARRWSRGTLSGDSTLEGVRAIDRWISGIGRLVQIIDPAMGEAQGQSVQKLHLIDRIAELEARIASASSRMTSDQLRETIAARRMQMRAIEELENQMERGLLRLEHAVSALGAIDAKLAMVAACDAGQMQEKLSAPDINSEIVEIDAVIAAMQRVYSVHQAQPRDGR